MTSLSLKDRVGVAAKAVKGIFSDESLQQTHGLLGGIFPGASGDPPQRGDANVLDAYNNMPWLRAVAQRVATAVASSSTGWRLYAPTSRRQRDVRKFQRCSDKAVRSGMIDKAIGDDLEVVEDHILLTALNGANSYMVGQALFKTTQIHLDLVGEAFWLKERNGVGAPVAFWPLPSNWVEATPTPSSRSFRVSFRGWQGRIPESEILWMAEPDPTNPYGRGSGMGRALGDELETDEYAAKHTRQLFFNRARPDLLVWPKSQGPHDPGLAPDQVRRLEERWLDGHQGFWRAFKPFFVGKEIGVHEVSQSLQELQMIELRKQQRDMVVQMFGIPPELLGILTNSNRATIDAADFLFSRWVVTPRLEFLRAQLQERLVPEYDDRLVIDYVSPIQEDREFMLEAGRAAPWAMTVDEWRVLQGQEPLPDGKGDSHLIPNNLVSAGTPYVAPAPVPGAPAGTPEALVVQSWDEAREVCKDAEDSDTLHLIHKLLDADDKLPNLADALVAQEGSLFRLIRRELVGFSQRATDEEVQGVIEQSLTVDAVAELTDMGGFFADLEKSLLPPMAKAWETGAKLAADDIDVTLEKGGSLDYFNEVNPEALKWSAAHTAEQIIEISRTTREGIQITIDRALREGWGAYKTARVIRRVSGLTRQYATAVVRYMDRLEGQGIAGDALIRKVSRYHSSLLRVRSAMIARTEIMMAGNAGQDQLWQIAKKNGVLNTSRVKRKLLTAGIGVCPICLRISSEAPVAFEAPFSNGLRIPPMHPNCRCRVILV
jgi:hypothetical protein